MKKFYLLLLFAFCSFVGNAQLEDVIRCATNEYHEHKMLTDPVYKANYKDAVKRRENAQPENRIACSGANTISIPLAFHFESTALSCADQACLLAEIQDQINALNIGFGDNTSGNNLAGNLVPDIANCPAAYEDGGGASVISTGTCLDFCLATPPAGNADGLTAIDPPVTFGVYSASGISAPTWTGVINIFVGDCGGGVLGFSPLPGSANGDGICMSSASFGGPTPSSGCGLDTNPTYGLGATLVHEMGHYLGLEHTWENGGGGGCGDGDGIADTPQGDDNPFFGCPGAGSGCQTNGCGNIQVANFMDYTDDACMAIFTEGQATVMNATAASLFASGSAACAATQSPTNLAQCLVCNVSNITSTAVCNGNDAEVTVCFDVTGGSGDYNLLNGPGGTLLQSIVGGVTDGTNICFTAATVAGPTTISTLTWVVTDINESPACEEAFNVTIPQCPPPVCPADPDYMVNLTPCSGDPIVFTPGPGCVNPVSTAFPGDDQFDYIILVYVDPVSGGLGLAPAGFDPIDMTNTISADLANVTPNGTNGGATIGDEFGYTSGTICSTSVDIGSVVNTECTPLDFSIFLIPVDYDDTDGDGSFITDEDSGLPGVCPVVQYNFSVLPEPVLSLDLSTNCTYTLNSTCGGSIAITSGANPTATVGGTGTDVLTYEVAEGDPATTLNIDVTYTSGATTCTFPYTVEIDAAPNLVDIGPFCVDDADANLSATPIPSNSETPFGSLVITICGDDFSGGETTWDLLDGTGASVIGGPIPYGGASPSDPATGTGCDVVTINNIPLNGPNPIGTNIVGDVIATTYDFVIFDSWGDGMQGLTCSAAFGGTVDGNYGVVDGAGATVVVTQPFEDDPANPCPGAAAPNMETTTGLSITVDEIVSDQGILSGTGVTDNGDGTGIFSPSTAGGGTHPVTYTYTYSSGLVCAVSDDVVVIEVADPTLTITDNICPTTIGTIVGTGAGGTITYYTGTDAATALANANGDIGGATTAPAYMVNPTVVYVCITETDINGCISNPVCGQTAPVACATCPDLTAQAPQAVISAESMCSTGCVVSGGTVAAPATACPTGSTLEYSIDGGSNWNSTIPTYNPTSSITVMTRCLCDLDMTTASPTNMIATVPGSCTNPADPTLTIVDNICPTTTGSISATGAGGTITYYTGSDATVAMANATSDIGGSAIAPAYAVSPTIVFVCITETDANGCVSNPVCGMTAPVNCSGPTITYDGGLSDPCDCNDDQTMNGAGDGTFTETVVYTTSPATPGLSLCVSNSSTGVTAGTAFTDNGDGTYEVTFNHIDGIGFSLSVADCSDLDTDIAGPIANICDYPIIALNLNTACDDDAAIDLLPLASETTGGAFAGGFSFSGTGVTGTLFDPVAAGVGMHPITVDYVPTAVVGINPGTIPSCSTQIIVTVNVVSCVTCTGTNGTLSIKTVQN